ncbi:hypothetical protein HZC27_01665 [Candidatus Roizmanbacteria bacterium]|nr:hypothetical protein [Candidatus Roizmanbacteria bacterium]
MPDKVNQSDLHINTNNGPDADGVDHKNTVGFGTEIFIGEPGTLVVQDPNMVGPSASLLGPDVQSSFNTVGPSIVQNPEGGALTSSLGYGKIEFTLIDGTAVTLDLPAIPDNVYLVDIKNDNRDGSTPKDGNSDVVFSGYHAGNTIATKYPPGQMISEGHFKQNVASGHTATLSTNAPGNACGADGCKKVTAIFIDRNTGAFTIIEQTELNGPWKLVQSNIK